MSLLKQLRHDLLFKARLSIPEVETLLAHPELAVEAEAATPTQAALRDILKQSPEAAVLLQAAIGTFERDLNRPAGFATAEEAAAAAAAAEEPAAAQASAPEQAGLVDQPTGGNGD